VHEPRSSVGGLVAGQERGQRVHARQWLAGVPGQVPVAVPLPQPPRHLAAQEAVRPAQVAQAEGHVVDAPDPREFGGGGSAEFPPPGRVRRVGRRLHHRVDPVDREHDHERDAEHRFVRARRRPAGMRYAGRGQRLQHPGLAQDDLTGPGPRVPGRPAQHVGGAAPDEADQEILRAALERGQVLDRPARKALLVQPAGQGLDVDQIAERWIARHGFTVTSPALAPRRLRLYFCQPRDAASSPVASFTGRDQRG